MISKLLTHDASLKSPTFGSTNKNEAKFFPKLRSRSTLIETGIDSGSDMLTED